MKHMRPTMKLFCRWALLIALILQVNGAVYKLDPANPRGFLVQNAKPSVAYIFVPPHTSQSTGLAVQSLKLEAQLRWAKIPYHKISNQFFLGSPTDGSTPFMQYNGQYFEGANNIYRHLKEEWAPKVPSEEEVGEISAAEGSQKRVPMPMEVEMVQKPKVAPESEWKSALSNMGAVSVLFKSKTATKPKIAMGHQMGEHSSACGQKGGPEDKKNDHKPDGKKIEKIAGFFKTGVTAVQTAISDPVLTETDILKSGQILTNILIADRIYRHDPKSEGLAYMLHDQGLQEQISPILFALSRMREEKRTKSGNEHQQQHEGSGGGELTTENVENVEAEMKAEMERKRKGKGIMPTKEEVPMPAGLKKLEELVLDRPLLKEYFAIRNNSQPSAQQSFLVRHHLLERRPTDIQIIESKSNTEIVELEPTPAGVDQQRMTWGQFDVWLQDQLQIELGPFLLNRQIGVEGSWHRFLSLAKPLDVEVWMWRTVQKGYVHCSDEEMVGAFEEALKPVLKQMKKQDKEKSKFLFGQEPTEADAHLFAVLLQYNRLTMSTDSRLSQSLIRRYLTADQFAIHIPDHPAMWAGSRRHASEQQLASENARLIRNYVRKMLVNLGWDETWMWKSVVSPWTLNEWNEPTRVTAVDEQENLEKKLKQLSTFYGEKYNGPFSIGKTDELFWLLKVNLAIPEFGIKQLLLAESVADNMNVELLALVLKKVMFYMRTGKFEWKEMEIGNYGEDLLHFVAAYLCNLGGKEKEVPAGGENVENAKAMEEQEEKKAKQCSQQHLMLIDGGLWQTLLHKEGPFTEEEWKVGVRGTIYEAVVEYNEGLVEERVEQAILEAAKEGRRADPGLGIEMF